MRLIEGKAPFIFPKKLAYDLSHNFVEADCEKLLKQVQSFGYKEILMPPIQTESPFFNQINKAALDQKIIPVHYLTVSNFCLNSELEKFLNEGVKFAITIYESLPSAFLEKIKKIEKYKDQIYYVFLGRKDWNIENTYKSLPHFIRQKLYVDFPVKLHESDPFFTPEEIETVIQKFKQNFKDAKIQSFAPHYQFYNEFISGGVRAVAESKEPKTGTPEFSIITSDKGVIDFLAKTVSGWRDNFEIIVPRFSDCKADVIPSSEVVNISKIWLHRFGEANKLNDRSSCMNEGALNARGEYIIFINDMDDLNKGILKSVLVDKDFEVNQLLSKGSLLIFDRELFLKWGGIDPLYCSLGCSDLEIIYRYLSNLGNKKIIDYSLIKKKTLSLDPLKIEIVARLLYGQYNDFKMYKEISVRTLEDMNREMASESKFLSLELRYRLERIRDAYLSLYKATPKVALEGNLKFLWSFIAPVLERLYFLLHGFYYKVLHRMYHLITWSIKKAFYKTLHPAYHGITWVIKKTFYKTLHPAYHGVTWAIKKTFYKTLHPAYHGIMWAIKKTFYKTLHPFYYRVIHRGYYKCHKFYYDYVFKALYPVRKIYYFSEYQYEKRVLGLHKRQGEK